MSDGLKFVKFGDLRFLEVPIQQIMVRSVGPGVSEAWFGG